MSSKQETFQATRRNKRLKVASACGECRRKKIKCNGEKPCSSCSKTNIECDYSRSLKPKPTSILDPKKNASLCTSAHTAVDPKSIHALENRLTVIEDVLRALLASSEKMPPLSPMSLHSDHCAEATTSVFGSKEWDSQHLKRLHSVTLVLFRVETRW
ncbi:hypothetical protein BDF14DRAFT_1742686 [Spinellus fusiger]|nr:hypothetical protein BDF14DRAFT_1742686 [Spinellus fusiger]